MSVSAGQAHLSSVRFSWSLGYRLMLVSVIRPAAGLLGALFVMAACTRAIAPLVQPAAAAVALTGGTNTSMVYLARTSEGIIAIDLGWWGASPRVAHALRSLNATPREVTHVFLTHSHRDHVGAWMLVRRARFHIAAPEALRLTGVEPHRGWIPRASDDLLAPTLPRPGTITVATFSDDTTFVLGADTLRAYVVPGHTPGSTVYLFRGILFLGDAVTFTRSSGFAPARRGYSDDPSGAARNLDRLWSRIPMSAVRYACTAHAHCATFDTAFLADVRQ